MLREIRRSISALLRAHGLSFEEPTIRFSALVHTNVKSISCGQSHFIALSGIIFKFVTVESSFWLSSFWEYFGLGVIGIFLYIFVPKYRNEFLYMHRTGGRKIFIVNIISELMTIFGNLLTNFALLLAPVAMVFLVGSFQPAIVLFLTIIGTKFFPHIIKEDISRNVLIPKIIAAVIMIIGSIFLFT